MAKFKGTISIGLVGCQRTFTFEIDDEDLAEMNDDEIEEIGMEVMWNYIDLEYERVD